jgi:hypothetical protein
LLRKDGRDPQPLQRRACIQKTIGGDEKPTAAWRRSIIPGTIAHCILDILGGLLGG